MMTDEFAAGFFDADGTLVARLRPEYPNSIHMSAEVTNTHLPVLDALEAAFGGAVRHHASPCGNRRRSWRWWVTGSVMEDFIRRITPHLVVKKSQAAAMLALRQVRDRGKREAFITTIKADKRPTFDWPRRAANDNVDRRFGKRRVA